MVVIGEAPPPFLVAAIVSGDPSAQRRHLMVAVARRIERAYARTCARTESVDSVADQRARSSLTSA
jgi:hypothetical protein